MKNKILSYILGGIFAVLLGFGGLRGTYVDAAAYSGKCGGKCDGYKLNTCFPIIGDCISTKGTDPTKAFPSMMSALTKIIMALILVICFILVIRAGVKRAMADGDSGKIKDAKKILTTVAITILLLGFSGVILRLINPNFFT